MLAPFLGSLAAAENPISTLRWLYTPGFEVTRRLLAGEIEVSHRGLDDAAVVAPQAVAFTRAKLVDSGVLEPRDEISAQFSRWHGQEILKIPEGVDRAHVRAYATWQVAHKLARSPRRSPAPLKYAKSQVTEAVNLVVWLHDRQLALADLRQDLLDEWVASGTTIRRRVRFFAQWLTRAGVAGRLTVAWDYRLSARPALDDEARFALLRRLLHDPGIDLRDRFAGSVLLLYGRPLTQVAALQINSVGVTADGQTTLRLARGAIPLPEPLDAIAAGLRVQRLEQVPETGWLFAGRDAGTHIAADTLLRRLKRYGIARATEGRHGALLALAARLPAPILAERLGIHQARAAQWVRLAGDTYADYAAIRVRA